MPSPLVRHQASGVEACLEASLRIWSSLGKEGPVVGSVFVPGLPEWLVRKLQCASKERARQGAHSMQSGA